MKNSATVALVATTVVSSPEALAHGGSCAISEWSVNLYIALGVMCAVSFVGLVIYGLIAIRGRLLWQLTTKLLLLLLFLTIAFLYFYINLGFLMGCGGSVAVAVIANAIPVFATAILIRWLKRLGSSRFA